MAMVFEYAANGVTKVVHDADSLREYLRSLDLDPETIKSIFFEEIEDEVEDRILDDYQHGRIDPRCDGLLGDAFYKYQDGIRNEIEELENDIYESLLSSSRKNNTKADIARRLKNIIDNLNDLV